MSNDDAIAAVDRAIEWMKHQCPSWKVPEDYRQELVQKIVDTYGSPVVD